MEKEKVLREIFRGALELAAVYSFYMLVIFLVSKAVCGYWAVVLVSMALSLGVSAAVLWLDSRFSLGYFRRPEINIKTRVIYFFLAIFMLVDRSSGFKFDEFGSVLEMTIWLTTFCVAIFAVNQKPVKSRPGGEFLSSSKGIKLLFLIWLAVVLFIIGFVVGRL